ncbi:hypothetical protein A2U01_0113350, partial [Trifolium medium]|nr:hypothetical protein [Trifolium medium]
TCVSPPISFQGSELPPGSFLWPGATDPQQQDLHHLETLEDSDC